MSSPFPVSVESMHALPPDTQRLIAFLRTIPATGDIPRWTTGFLEALKKLLPDVDLLVARVVYSCDIHAPEGESPRFLTTIRNNTVIDGPPSDVEIEEFPTRSPSAGMIARYEGMKELKGRYTYTGYDYRGPNGTYVGSIVLAEMKGRSPIGPATFQLMEQLDRLEPFLDLTRLCWRTRAYGDFWSYMLVAEGAVDIACEPELAVHDMAALVPIVTEAGGRFTSLDGEPGPWGGNAVATNGLLHDEVLDILR